MEKMHEMIKTKPKRNQITGKYLAKETVTIRHQRNM